MKKSYDPDEIKRFLEQANVKKQQEALRIPCEAIVINDEVQFSHLQGY